MLNGTKEDVETLKSRMEERRLRARLGKVTVPCVSLSCRSLQVPPASPLPQRPLQSPLCAAGGRLGFAEAEALLTAWGPGCWGESVPARP